MPLRDSTYKPRFFMRHPHVHTIVPALFRKVPFAFTARNRFTLSDGDFVDVDTSLNGHQKAVLLCHGLEGSSQSRYILGMAQAMQEAGFDVLALNYRSCSGEMNRKPRFYHHLAFEDLQEVVQHYVSRYNSFTLIGFSLGANMVLHYLAHLAVQAGAVREKVKAAVCFSAPVDLTGCVTEIHKPKNRIYHDRFLRSIKQKIASKQQTMPETRLRPLESIRTLYALDEHYTAPLHGFSSAADYHQKASCADKLTLINTPVLLVNAQDDPFLSEGCFPAGVAKASHFVHLQQPRFGGHVGFSGKGRGLYWSEAGAIAFLKEQKVL